MVNDHFCLCASFYIQFSFLRIKKFTVQLRADTTDRDWLSDPHMCSHFALAFNGDDKKQKIRQKKLKKEKLEMLVTVTVARSC